MRTPPSTLSARLHGCSTGTIRPNSCRSKPSARWITITGKDGQNLQHEWATISGTECQHHWNTQLWAQNGAAGWQTQKVLGENGLPQGIYQLSSANDASKKVHPQQFGGQVLHVDKQNVYQFGPSDGKGKSTVVKHDRKIFDQALDGKEPVVGQCYEVSYARGVGKVKGELSQEEGAKLQNRKVNKI